MSELKLEVGKSYRDRRGKVVKIIHDDGTPVIPFEGDNDIWYTPDGRVTLTKETEFDLIEEVEPESKPDKKATMLKLEVGKSYWNRKGEVVKIIGQGDYGLCAYIDSDARAYKTDGRYANSRHPYNLIEEVLPEPKRRKVKWPIRGRVKRKDTSEAIYYTPDEVEMIIGNPTYTYPEAEESFGPLADAKAAFERALDEYEAEPEPPELTFTQDEYAAALRLAGIDTNRPELFYRIAMLLQETNGDPAMKEVMEVWENDHA